jgi:hypothetical protein
MTAFVVFLALIAFFALAGFVSARDMRPQRRPPEWSIGQLIAPRR